MSYRWSEIRKSDNFTDEKENSCLSRSWYAVAGWFLGNAESFVKCIVSLVGFCCIGYAISSKEQFLYQTEHAD